MSKRDFESKGKQYVGMPKPATVESPQCVCPFPRSTCPGCHWACVVCESTQGECPYPVGLDATDGACPAWWRGQEHGAKKALPTDVASALAKWRGLDAERQSRVLCYLDNAYQSSEELEDGCDFARELLAALAKP